MTEDIRPKRGGFLRPFGCGWFIREFLLDHGPGGSPVIDPEIGAVQADIFYCYKTALRQATAPDRATGAEEKKSRQEERPINPDTIEKLAERYLARLPYKAQGARYHSLIVYFSTLQRLGWVKSTGQEEASVFQEHYPPGPPLRYFRLTSAGLIVGDRSWANPHPLWE